MFEYNLVTVGNPEENPEPALLETANDLAKNGWEVVSVWPTIHNLDGQSEEYEGCLSVLLKRKK